MRQNSAADEFEREIIQLTDGKMYTLRLATNVVAVKVQGRIGEADEQMIGHVVSTYGGGLERTSQNTWVVQF